MNLRLSTLSAFVLLAIAAGAYGSNHKVKVGSLVGTVLDQKTRIGIPLAVVLVPGTDCIDTADVSGAFILDSVPAGVVDVEVRAERYDTRIHPSLEVGIGTNRPIVIELAESSIRELDRMVVTSARVTQKSSEQTTSVVKITRDEINKAPGGLQDVNRVLLTMPAAVSGDDDSETDLFVRGGSTHENVFLLDDIEVNNLSHWGEEYGSGGQISSLHPDFIRDLDFYAGGFPARLPPRLSSVTDIHFREGSMTDRTWQIDMSLAGFGAFIEGPLVPGRASYMLNARISALDLVEPLIDEGGLPQYQNGQLKLVFKLSDTDKLIANALVSHETIDMDAEGGDYMYYMEGTRVIGGLQWQRHTDRYLNKLLVSGLFHGFSDENWAVDSIMTWGYNTDRTRLQVKDDLNIYLRDDDILSFGMVAEYDGRQERIGWDDYYLITDGTQYFQQTTAPDSTDTTLVVLIEDPAQSTSTDTAMLRVAAYAGYTAQLGKLKLYAGVRDDYFSLVNKHGVSPRVSATLDLGKPGAISLSGGLHYQFPEYVALMDLQEDLDDVELQRNVQACIAYEKQFSDVIVGGVEVYGKYYDREPNYIIASDAWVEGHRAIDTNFTKHGTKYAYGLELYLQKKRQDKFYYSLAYTLFNAQVQYDDGEWHPDDRNIRNNLNLVVGSRINRHNQIALRLDVSEGYPYTPIDKDASAAAMHTVWDVSEGWNSRRRHARAKVGLRYDLTLYFKRVNLTLYADITNLFNQQDVVFEWYEFGDEPPGKVVRYYSRGILPIGGLKIDF